MLWTELQDRVLIGLDPQRKTLLKTRAYKYLHDAEEDFVLYTDCLEFNFTASMAKAEYSLALPETFLDVQRVSFDGRKLEFMPLWTATDLKDSSSAWVLGLPTHYLIQGRELFLYPGTDTAGKLTLWCQGIFSSSAIDAFEDLSLIKWEDWDEDIFRDYENQPSVPFEYHKYLVDYARSLLTEEEGNTAMSDRLMNRYLMNREKIKGIYARQKNPVVGRVMDAIDGQVA